MNAETTIDGVPARAVVLHAIRKGWAKMPARELTESQVATVKKQISRSVMRECAHCGATFAQGSESWGGMCLKHPSIGTHEPGRTYVDARMD